MQACFWDQRKRGDQGRQPDVCKDSHCGMRCTGVWENLEGVSEGQKSLCEGRKEECVCKLDVYV